MFFNALVTWSRRLKATVIGNILSLINFFVDTNCPFEYNWKLKTEKYCNKIIFKCVNSIVRPIFNEKVDKKWYLWVHKQCTNALFMVEKVSLYSWKKKKKKKKSWNAFCAQTWTQNAQTKHTLICTFSVGSPIL